MSFKFKPLLPLALAGALLLSGCGAQQTGTATRSDTVTQSDTVTPSDTATSNDTATNGDTATQSDTPTSNNTATSGDAVTITLNGTTALADSDAVRVNGSTVTITAAGTYILSGALDGSVIVDAAKEDEVQLVLDGVTIHADSFAALYVVQADKVFVTLAEGTVNVLSNLSLIHI